MEGNLINNCDFLTYVIFVGGGVHYYFSVLASKKPSYATGIWPACIDYHSKLHLIWCMIYATLLNICSSIDIWYVTSRWNCNLSMISQSHWNMLENLGFKIIGTYITKISLSLAVNKQLLINGIFNSSNFQTCRRIDCL